ncbi:MAG: 1-(5-phosphoribosyl)-5-[(5-phosphoribosylamino)methylideneamino] imidazole-4-carboxamide isomerase [Sphingomicrobium sp.]
MILLPAIDLIEGRCVRLAQGDFDRETTYSDDPAAALLAFAAEGAVEAHLVDLDGARAREPRQHDLFITLARTTSLALQVAGGFRTVDQVRRVLDAGVARVVVGSLAIDDPDAFARMIDEFGPDRLTLALDIWIEDGMPLVATHGWATGSGQTLDAVLLRYPSIRHVLVTDIARDGMLEGPNLALMQAIIAAHPGVGLQASGGVATLEDLTELAQAGAARAIVGKAIWEQRFTVAEAVSHAHG